MLRRRWYAVVLGLFLTIGLGFLATVVVPLSYETKAQVMLVPPAPVEPPENPYLNLGSLTGVSNALTRAMADPSVTSTLKDQGATAEYIVESDTLTPGPIILVTTSDNSPATALSTMDAIVDLLPEYLQTMQTSEGVEPESLITLTVLSKSTKAEPAIKGQLRAILVAVAGGIALTWMGTAALDAGLRRSRSTSGPRAHQAMPASVPVSAAPQLGPGVPPPQSPSGLPGTAGVTDFSQIVAGQPGQRSIPPSAPSWHPQPVGPAESTIQVVTPPTPTITPDAEPATEEPPTETPAALQTEEPPTETPAALQTEEPAPPQAEEQPSAAPVETDSEDGDDGSDATPALSTKKSPQSTKLARSTKPADTEKSIPWIPLPGSSQNPCLEQEDCALPPTPRSAT